MTIAATEFWTSLLYCIYQFCEVELFTIDKNSFRTLESHTHVRYETGNNNNHTNGAGESIVPDFTISVYGSSCNSLIFGLILTSFLS